MKDLQFVRYKNREILYLDETRTEQIWYSVTFEILQDEINLATLVTNNSKALTYSDANIRLQLKCKYLWLKLTSKCRIYDSNTSEIVAEVDVRQGLFVRNKYKIWVKDFGNLAIRRMRSKELPKGEMDNGYEFIQGSDLVCRIVYHEERSKYWLTSSEYANNARLNGTILYDQRLTLTHLVCFLQIMNIHIQEENSFN